MSARIDHRRVREHVVDTNDGIIAPAGIVEGLLGAGASSTILLVASLAAYAEAEYGISPRDRPASPWSIAVVAGLAFALGAGVPVLVVLLAPPAWRSAATVLAAVVALSLTASVSASVSNTNIPRTMLRTVSIGVATMVLTFVGGLLLG
jgi:vacuolar iron transporter family protein